MNTKQRLAAAERRLREATTKRDKAAARHQLYQAIKEYTKEYTRQGVKR